MKTWDHCLVGGPAGDNCVDRGGGPTQHPIGEDPREDLNGAGRYTGTQRTHVSMYPTSSGDFSPLEMVVSTPSTKPAHSQAHDETRLRRAACSTPSSFVASSSRPRRSTSSVPALNASNNGRRSSQGLLEPSAPTTTASSGAAGSRTDAVSGHTSQPPTTSMS